LFISMVRILDLSCQTERGEVRYLTACVFMIPACLPACFASLKMPSTITFLNAQVCDPDKSGQATRKYNQGTKVCDTIINMHANKLRI